MAAAFHTTARAGAVTRLDPQGISPTLGLRWLLMVMLMLVIAFPAALPAQDAAEPAGATQTVTLQVGQSKRIAAALIYDAAGESVRYESGNAGFFTVDAQGVLTGVHEGSTMLSIIEADGTRKQIPVTVTAAVKPEPKAPPKPAAEPTTKPADQRPVDTRGVPSTGVVIGNEGGEIELGRLERIIAHVLPYQVIGSNPFTISSSNPSVIAVNDDVKVIEAVGEGAATVTVTTLDGRHRDTVTYRVVPARAFDQSNAKTYELEPEKFGIRYGDDSEAAAIANSAGLYEALRYTADNGYQRLLLQSDAVMYIEPKETIHMVSNVTLDLGGSEIRLRPNDYERYVAFLFAEKDRTRVLENAAIVNGTLTGERDGKEAVYPGWAKVQATEAGCTIVFDEGYNNGIRNLTVRKSIGFNISSGLGSKSHGVQRFTQGTVSTRNMEPGAFNERGKPVKAQGQIRTKEPIDVSSFTTPYYTLGYPLGYMGYPYMNSRIYDAYFFDKKMKLLSATRGRIRYRQYTLPEGAAYVHLAFYHDGVPARGNSDFGDAFAFVENRAMPIDNYIIDCVIEDNYSCGFAACGGQGWIIRDNVFRRNGGRMPGADIDWEDGWEYMQGDLVEGNTFESRLNVITCAGAGLVFRNNTFRGESVFYGRTQHYSVMNNVFEPGDGEQAHDVKVSFASQTDIYAKGNVYRHASVGYAKQHAKEPFIGTYEATFADETFDHTQIRPGHLTRLVNCSIGGASDWSLISADHLVNCTIEQGSYIVGGTIHGGAIDQVQFRIAPGERLTVENVKLTNPYFSASADCEGLVLDGCDITIDEGEQLLTPNHMASVAIRDTTIQIDSSATEYALVGGWNATDVGTTIALDRVRLEVPSGFKGYLHKFAWYPSDADGPKITYQVRNSDVSKLMRTDDRGDKSNVVFNIAR